MKPKNIYEGVSAPEKHNLWLYKGVLKFYGDNGWETIRVGSQLVNWDSITGKPTFSKVATSGSYVDLSNKPTIPSYSAVTSDKDGLMTIALFQKLNGIEAQANKYVLPAAGAAIGGVKKASAVADTLATEEATAQSVATTLNNLLAALRASGVLTA